MTFILTWQFFVCLLAFIGLIIAVENEGNIWGLVIIVAALITLQYWLDIKVLSFIKDHPWHIVIGILIYFPLGVVWSIVKWWFHLIKLKDEGESKPKLEYNKGKIICWMSYWPASLFWTLCHDFVEKIFNILFEKFKKIYQGICDKVYKEEGKENE